MPDLPVLPSESTFITSDRYMVAYFLTHGFRWTATSYDGRILSFLFPATSECEELQTEYLKHGLLLRYRMALEEVWDVIQARQREAT